MSNFIYPQSDIYLLHNVPLDKSYDHTIYWEDTPNGETARDKQIRYFTSSSNNPRLKYKLPYNSYQRVNRGWLRVGYNAELLYDCNYLAFKNNRRINETNIGKWYFAFITSVEYINENVTEIKFEIDVMQTWFFDYEMEECFVEREHSATDGYFDNLIAEDVNLGNEYIINNTDWFDMNRMNLCILANRVLAGGGQSPSEIVNNVYTPVRIVEHIAVEPSKIAQIDNIFNDYNQDDVIAVYQYPRTFEPAERPDLVAYESVGAGLSEIFVHTQTTGSAIPENELSEEIIYIGTDTTPYTVVLNTRIANTGSGKITLAQNLREGVTSGDAIRFSGNPKSPKRSKDITLNNTLNGHTPRNKKLYSYPFNKLIVSNNCGEVAEYKWEYLNLNDNNQTTFEFQCAVVSTPAVLCYPLSYRGTSLAYDAGIIYSNFPQCAWAGDVFKAWWAQNKASFVTSGLTSVVSAVANGVVGSMGGVNASSIVHSALNIGATVANSVAKIEDIKNTPSQTHGQTQTDSLNPAIKKVEFTFFKASINKQYAEIIDDYFDRYGYATKRNKIPNRAVRQHWCYVKTTGCTVKGSIPAEDMEKIIGIYDNGVTFWKSADAFNNTICDYSQTNSILN